MTLENKIRNGSVQQLSGSKVEPTGDLARQSTTKVSGGAVNKTRTEHVTNRNHEIDHLQEKTTYSSPIFYQTDNGNINPSQGSRFMIRASGGLTFNLNKSQAFPTSQQHPVVNRYREWDVEITIYNAAANSHTWPAGIIWQIAAPENPRPASTSDRVIFRYNERTGEWFAWSVIVGVPSTDPESPVDEVTDDNPDDVIEEPEDGLGEEDYPDMLAKFGELYALHDNGYSYSSSAGAEWQYNLLPFTPSSFDVLNSVFFVSESGKGYVLTEAGDIPTQLLFEREIVESVFVLNADLETGDTTGWTVLPENSATVLNTVQPPQRPGSLHYLTRADETPMTTEWNVSQVVPESIIGRRLDVSVDVFREAGSEAKVLVLGEGPKIGILNFSNAQVLPGDARSVGRTWEVPNFIVNDDVEVSASFEVLSASSRVNSVEGGYFSDYGLVILSSGVGSARIGVTLSQASDGALLEFDDINEENGESVTIHTEDLEVFQHTNNDKKIAVSLPVGTSYFEFTLSGRSSGVGLQNANPLEYVNAPNPNQKILEPTEDNEWQTLTTTVYFADLSSALITLRGLGNAYFDNLQITDEVLGDEYVISVSRDTQRGRFIVGTLNSIFEVSGQQVTFISEPPVRPEKISVLGSYIVVSSANKVAFSSDNGETWTYGNLPVNVVEAFIIPEEASSLPSSIEGLVDGLRGLTAVTNTIIQVVGNEAIDTAEPKIFETKFVTLDTNGTFYRLRSYNGVFVFNLLSETDIVDVDWDARRKKWVGIDQDGDVLISNKFEQWSPVSDADLGFTDGSYGILATDIGRWISFSKSNVTVSYNDDQSSNFTLSRQFKYGVNDIKERK